MGRVALMGSPRYMPEDVDRALLALIVCGDSAENAVKLLRANGVERVPGRTALRQWADITHADRYVELQTEQAPRIAERIAGQAEALALRFATIEDALADQIEAETRAGTLKDPAGALRSVSTAKALQIDKLSSPLRGRPTVITEHRDPKQAAALLARRLGIVIDSTAEEETVQQLTP